MSTRRMKKDYKAPNLFRGWNSGDARTSTDLLTQSVSDISIILNHITVERGGV